MRVLFLSLSIVIILCAQSGAKEVENVGASDKILPMVTEDIAEDNKSKEEYESEISYYIKNMNLSVEQQDLAKYISTESRLKLEQLIRSIYVFRAHARELENKSMNDFEAILTEEQKEQFRKLREIQQKERKNYEVFCIKSDNRQYEDIAKDEVPEEEGEEE